MTLEPSLLVMGARTGIGRLVVDELVARGLSVRASSRRPSAAPPGSRVETVVADLDDPSTLPAAFAGVTRAFVLAVRPAAAGPLLRTAREAGVERLVLLSSGSVLLPSSAANPITVEHREVEEALTGVAGPALVPVRPLVLATNALGWAAQVRAAGQVGLYQPDALSAPVHEADVAAVAAVALTAHSLPDGSEVSRLLTGPGRLTQREQVAAIGEAVGRRITVVEQDRAEAVDRMSRFVPRAEAEAVADFLDDCEAGNSPATGTAAEVLGRPPRDFHTWARDHAEDFR